MTDWPQYESHKIVRAAKIVTIRTKDGEVTGMLVRPIDGEMDEEFMPTERVMAQRAKLGDWAMLYSDGFKSISPAKAFEEGYTRVQQ